MPSAFKRDYIVNVSGDTSKLEAAIKRAGGEMEKLNDKQVALKFNFQQKEARAQATAAIADLEAHIPGIGVNLEVDAREAEKYQNAIRKQRVIDRLISDTQSVGGNFRKRQYGTNLTEEQVRAENAKQTLAEYGKGLKEAINGEEALDIIQQAYAYIGKAYRITGAKEGVKDIDVSSDVDDFMSLIDKSILEEIKPVILQRRKAWIDSIGVFGSDKNEIRDTIKNLESKQRIYDYGIDYKTQQKAEKKESGQKVHETEHKGYQQREEKQEEKKKPKGKSESVVTTIDPEQLVNSIREALQGKDFEIAVTPAVHWDTTSLEKTLGSTEALDKVLGDQSKTQLSSIIKETYSKGQLETVDVQKLSQEEIHDWAQRIAKSCQDAGVDVSEFVTEVRSQFDITAESVQPQVDAIQKVSDGIRELTTLLSSVTTVNGSFFDTSNLEGFLSNPDNIQATHIAAFTDGVESQARKLSDIISNVIGDDMTKIDWSALSTDQIHEWAQKIATECDAAGLQIDELYQKTETRQLNIPMPDINGVVNKIESVIDSIQNLGRAFGEIDIKNPLDYTSGIDGLASKLDALITKAGELSAAFSKINIEFPEQKDYSNGIDRILVLLQGLVNFIREHVEAAEKSAEAMGTEADRFSNVAKQAEQATIHKAAFVKINEELASQIQASIDALNGEANAFERIAEAVSRISDNKEVFDAVSKVTKKSATIASVASTDEDEEGGFNGLDIASRRQIYGFNKRLRGTRGLVPPKDRELYTEYGNFTRQMFERGHINFKGKELDTKESLFVIQKHVDSIMDKANYMATTSAKTLMDLESRVSNSATLQDAGFGDVVASLRDEFINADSIDAIIEFNQKVKQTLNDINTYEDSIKASEEYTKRFDKQEGKLKEFEKSQSESGIYQGLRYNGNLTGFGAPAVSEVSNNYLEEFQAFKERFYNSVHSMEDLAEFIKDFDAFKTRADANVANVYEQRGMADKNRDVSKTRAKLEADLKGNGITRESNKKIYTELDNAFNLIDEYMERGMTDIVDQIMADIKNRVGDTVGESKPANQYDKNALAIDDLSKKIQENNLGDVGEYILEKLRTKNEEAKENIGMLKNVQQAIKKENNAVESIIKESSSFNKTRDDAIAQLNRKVVTSNNNNKQGMDILEDGLKQVKASNSKDEISRIVNDTIYLFNEELKKGKKKIEFDNLVGKERSKISGFESRIAGSPALQASGLTDILMERLKQQSYVVQDNEQLEKLKAANKATKNQFDAIEKLDTDKKSAVEQISGFRDKLKSEGVADDSAIMKELDDTVDQINNVVVGNGGVIPKIIANARQKAMIAVKNQKTANKQVAADKKAFDKLYTDTSNGIATTLTRIDEEGLGRWGFADRAKKLQEELDDAFAGDNVAGVNAVKDALSSLNSEIDGATNGQKALDDALASVIKEGKSNIQSLSSSVPSLAKDFIALNDGTVLTEPERNVKQARMKQFADTHTFVENLDDETDPGGEIRAQWDAFVTALSAKINEKIRERLVALQNQAEKEQASAQKGGKVIEEGRQKLQDFIINSVKKKQEEQQDNSSWDITSGEGVGNLLNPLFGAQENGAPSPAEQLGQHTKGDTYASVGSLTTLLQRINSDMANNNLKGDLLERYTNLRDRIESVVKVGGEFVKTQKEITNADLAKLDAEYRSMNAEMYKLNQNGIGFVKMISKGIASQSAQFIARYFSLNDIIRYTRQAMSTVQQVNSALVELRKVSDASNERIQQSFEKSSQTAQELGATITEVINSTADWARLGYDVDQAEELARVTTLYQTVGDNMTQESASSSLISTLKGFQIDAEESEQIVDKFNEVANNYAIDTAGIGAALQRSASAFNAAHTSLDKSIALITTTNAVLQNPEAVGTLWNTMSARIRGAKTELDDLNEESDEYVKSTSKLQELVKGMTGFDILEEDGETFKDIYDIVVGIGKEWKNLSDTSQASLAEALAGKRNSKGLFAVLNNIEELQSVYETSLGSEGSAQQELEHYKEGIEYSVNQAKASLQELATDFLSSETLKQLIDFGNRAIRFLDNVVEHLGLVKTALAGLGIRQLIMGIGDPSGNSMGAQIIRYIMGSGRAFLQTKETKNTLASLLSVTGERDTNGIIKQLKNLGSHQDAATVLLANGVQGTEALGYLKGAYSDVAEATLEADLATTTFSRNLSKTTSGVVAGATKGLDGLKTALAGLFSNWPVLQGAAAVAGITIAVAHQQKVHRELLQGAEDAAREWTSDQSNLQSYEQQYKSLKEKMDDATLSDSEHLAIKQQIYDLQKTIVASYGDEVSGIDLVNGGLNEEIEKLREIRKISASRNLSENAEKYDEAEKELSKGMTGEYGAISLFGSRTFAGIGEEYASVLTQEIQKAVIDSDVFRFVGQDGNNFLDLRLDETGNYNVSREEYYKAYEELFSRLSALRNKYIVSGQKDLAKGLDSFLKILSNNSEAAIETVEKYGDVIAARNTAIFEANGGADYIDRLTSSVEEYNKAIEAGDLSAALLAKSDIEAASDDARNLVKNLDDLKDLDIESIISDKVDAMNESGETEIVFKTALSSNYRDVVSKVRLEARDAYDALKEELTLLDEGGELTDAASTVFGNIDLDDRPIIEWTEELKAHYKNALDSLDLDPEIGSISTVLGGSSRFGEDIDGTGVEVAFTPVMRLPHGGTTVLDRDTIRQYIESLIQDATEDGSAVTEERQQELDRAGKQIGEQFVSNIIAAVDASVDEETNRAIRVGSMMHSLGSSGGIATANNDFVGKQAQYEILEEAEGINIQGEAIREQGLDGVDAERLLDLSTMQAVTSKEQNLLKELGKRFGIVFDGSEADAKKIQALVKILMEQGIVARSAEYAITSYKRSLDEQGVAATNSKDAIDTLNTMRELSFSKTGSSLSGETFASWLSEDNYDKLAEYADALEYVNGTLVLNQDKIKELVELKAQERIELNNTKKAQLQQEYKENTAQIAKLNEELKTNNKLTLSQEKSIRAQISGYEEANKSIIRQCDAYDLLNANIREASGSYQAWLAAQNAGTSGDMLTDLIEATNVIREVTTEGTKTYGMSGEGNIPYRAAIDLIVPGEIDPEDEEAVKAYLDSIGYALRKNADGEFEGLNLGGFIDEAISRGLMRDNGKEYEIAGRMSMEHFAEGMGMSLELVQAIFGYLQMYPNNFTWADESAKSLEYFTKEADAARKSQMQQAKNNRIKVNLITDVSNIKDEEDKITTLRNTIDEVNNMKATLNLDEEQLQEANSVIASCLLQIYELQKPQILTVDTTNLTTEQENVRDLIEDLYTSYENYKIDLAIGVPEDESQFKGQMDDVVAKIQEQDPEILASLGIKDTTSVDTILADLKTKYAEDTLNVTLEANTEKANEELTKIDEIKIQDKTFSVMVQDREARRQLSELNATEIPTKKIPIEIDPLGLSVVKQQLQDLQNMGTGTYTVNVTSKPLPNKPNTNNPTQLQGTAHAGGTSGDWGMDMMRRVLIGELGREIVVDPHTGKWQTYGDNGAEFARIPKDAIVFNHEQTESLLKQGFVHSRATMAMVRGNAFASGNAFVGGGLDKDAVQKDATHYDDTKKNTDATKENTQSTDDNTEAEKEVKSALENVQDWIEIAISRLARQADWYKNYATLLAGTSKEMEGIQKAINATSQQMKANEDASQAYRQKAESIKLDPEYARRVREGIIAKDANGNWHGLEGIESETLRQQIADYSDMYEKALAADDAALQLKIDLNELAQQSLDAVAEGFERTANLAKAITENLEIQGEIEELRDGFTSITNLQQRQAQLSKDAENSEKARAAYVAEYERLKAQGLLNAAQDAEYQQKIQEYDNDILTKEKERLELNKEISELFDKQVEAVKKIYEGMKSINSLQKTGLETQGEIEEMRDGFTSIGNYLDRIGLTYESDNILAQERVDIEEQFLQNLRDGMDPALAQQKMQEAMLENDNARLENERERLSLEDSITESMRTQWRVASDSDTAHGSMFAAHNSLYETWNGVGDIGLLQDQIRTEDNKRYHLTGERQALQSRINDRLANGTLEYGSTDYTAMLGELAKIDEEIYSSAENTVKLNQAIRDVNWKPWHDAISDIEHMDKQLGSVLDIVGNLSSFDSDTGLVTDAGITKMNLYAQGIANARTEIADYDQAMKKLGVQLKDETISQNDYNQQMKEMSDGKMEAIALTNKYRQAIISEVKEGLDAEVAAMQKVIDKRKEDLQKQKEANDYAKNVRNQVKDINKLRAQLQALEGDDSQEAWAKRQQIQADISEKEEALEETRLDHEYDMNVQALDERARISQELADKEKTRLDADSAYQESVIQENLQFTTKQYQDTFNVLDEQAKIFGTNFEESITNPWKTATAAAEAYKEATAGIVTKDFGRTGTSDTTKSEATKASKGAKNKANTDISTKGYTDIGTGGGVTGSLIGGKQSVKELKTNPKANAVKDTALLSEIEKRQLEQVGIRSVDTSDKSNGKTSGVLVNETINSIKSSSKNPWYAYSPVFDPAYYLSHNADLKAAFGNDYNKAWQHFLNYGIAEGRRASEEFDPAYYKKTNPDVAKAMPIGETFPNVKSEWEKYYSHYLKYGRSENRKNPSKRKGHARYGARNAKGLYLTDEQGVGTEAIITKSGVLRQLDSDTVFSKAQTDALWKMSKMENIDSMLNTAKSSVINAGTTITNSYGSLLTVNGNVDKDALPGLQEILKQACEYTKRDMRTNFKKMGVPTPI